MIEVAASGGSKNMALNFIIVYAFAITKRGGTKKVVGSCSRRQPRCIASKSCSVVNLSSRLLEEDDCLRH